MENNKKKLVIKNKSMKRNIINNNGRNISPNILPKKYIKNFFITENIFKHTETNTNLTFSGLIRNKNDYLSERKTYEINNKISCINEYISQINKKITTQPKKRIKYKAIRNIYLKEKQKEKRLKSPLKNNNNSISKTSNKSKTNKNLVLKINLDLKKSNNNTKNKKFIFSHNKINFSLENILSKKKINHKKYKTKTKTNSLDNKRIIINNSPKIKFKYMENKLNNEKIKRNKKYFNERKKREKSTKIIFNKNKRKEEKNSVNVHLNNIKNIKTKIVRNNINNNSNNNFKLLSDNISTNYKSLNSKNRINMTNQKKQTMNKIPNINNRKKNKISDKIISCKITEREISYKLLEFGLENEKNEKINGVKINNFEINKPKEENLKFTFTKEEKYSEISVSCANKVIIGKIDGYKDIIDTDKKNNEKFKYNTNLLNKKLELNTIKNIKINKNIINDDKDSFIFNENEVSENINFEDLLSSTNTNNNKNGNTIEKINYDYNKDSFYFETHEKSVNKNNNKNFEATYFFINKKKSNNDVSKKDNLNLIKMDNKDKRKAENTDNCHIF